LCVCVVCCVVFFFFFFSSRRRHTRFSRDWSSDVCSSDLGLFRIVLGVLFASEGAATLFGVLDRKASPVGEWPFWYAGVIELVCRSEERRVGKECRSRWGREQ